MNACDRFLPLFNALLDGELANDQTHEVEVHLESCEACQREWESLRKVDVQLSRHLVVCDVVSKAGAIARAAEPLSLPKPTDASRIRWISLVVSIAAVLLIALLPALWAVKDKQHASNSENTIVARLVRSTGPVQVLMPRGNAWTTVKAEATPALLSGSRLKTSENVLCELETSEKGTIRLNQSAELILRSAKQVELVSGQLWCSATENSEINVDVAVNNVNPPQMAHFSCPSSSEVQCESESDRTHYVSVSSENAETCVTMGNFSCVVSPGEMVSIDSANKVERTTNADSIAKIWQLPLLAINGGADKELNLLLKYVLAPIGMTKAIHLNERQLQQLGPNGSIPLLVYALTEKAPEHLSLRRTAVRLASELADRRAASLLESLRDDPDAFIADLAKSTLARILNNPE